MQLFQLKNYQVIFEPQTLMIKEFAAVRDNNIGHDDLILKEMSFIWFFADVRSDFQNIVNEHERMIEIASSVNLPEDWKPSKEVMNAIDFYREYSKTPSSGLYNSSIITVKHIETKLKNPEALLGELDGRGNPIYKLDTLLKLVKDVPETMKKLHDARQQVIKEIESQSSLKGEKTKSMFEDGI